MKWLDSQPSTQWKINGVMSSSELVFNGKWGYLFKSNAVQSACPLLKECNTESAEYTSLEGLCINEKNKIKVWYNLYRLEMDWEKNLPRQMLSDLQWKQLNRKVKLENIISTLGLKGRLWLQWTDVKMKLFLKTMKISYVAVYKNQDRNYNIVLIWMGKKRRITSSAAQIYRNRSFGYFHKISKKKLWSV